MTELTLQEKQRIVRDKFGAWSVEQMKRHDDDGDSRPALIAVDSELQSVLETMGIAQFRGLTIRHRETGESIRSSKTHPERRPRKS